MSLLVFLEAIDGHDSASLLLAAQSDLSDHAAADHTNGFEVLIADILPPLPEPCILVLDDILFWHLRACRL